MAKPKEAPGLLQRTVVGNKVYWHIDPETGKHVPVAPGTTISVAAKQARGHKHRLQDPKVAVAQKAADKAAEEAEAAAATPTPPAPAPDSKEFPDQGAT